MKKRKQITIKISFSNRWLYAFIIFGILLIAAVGVYAYGTSNPSVFGHSGAEITVDNTFCARVSGHNCGYDTDTIPTKAFVLGLFTKTAIYHANSHCSGGGSLTTSSGCNTQYDGYQSNSFIGYVIS